VMEVVLKLVGFYLSTKLESRYEFRSESRKHPGCYGTRKGGMELDCYCDVLYKPKMGLASKCLECRYWELDKQFVFFQRPVQST
jgi:hypothetical protein